MLLYRTQAHTYTRTYVGPSRLASHPVAQIASQQVSQPEGHPARQPASSPAGQPCGRQPPLKYATAIGLCCKLREFGSGRRPHDRDAIWRARRAKVHRIHSSSHGNYDSHSFWGALSGCSRQSFMVEGRRRRLPFKVTRMSLICDGDVRHLHIAAS